MSQLNTPASQQSQSKIPAVPSVPSKPMPIDPSMFGQIAGGASGDSNSAPVGNW